MEAGLSTCPKTFSELYAPNYQRHEITKQKFLQLNKSTLCFDWFARGFEFVRGSISCTGVELIFKNEYFEKIIISPRYEYRTGKLYNSVLAIPSYTENDRLGRKNITQTSNMVRSDKDLDRYLKKLFNRFDCPLIE
jgi:hypothetical protein